MKGRRSDQWQSERNRERNLHGEKAERVVRAQHRRTTHQAQHELRRGKDQGTAYAQDRDFYLFLEKLRSFQAMLADTRDVLLLSTKHPLFDVFRGPPMAPPPK